MKIKEIILISFILFAGFVLFQKTELEYKINLEGNIALDNDLLMNLTNQSYVNDFRFNKIEVEGSAKLPNWAWLILI